MSLDPVGGLVVWAYDWLGDVLAVSYTVESVSPTGAMVVVITMPRTGWAVISAHGKRTRVDTFSQQSVRVLVPAPDPDWVGFDESQVLDARARRAAERAPERTVRVGAQRMIEAAR